MILGNGNGIAGVPKKVGIALRSKVELKVSGTWHV